jgi:hypothetical protein
LIRRTVSPTSRRVMSTPMYRQSASVACWMVWYFGTGQPARHSAARLTREDDETNTRARFGVMRACGARRVGLSYAACAYLLIRMLGVAVEGVASAGGEEFCDAADVPGKAGSAAVEADVAAVGCDLSGDGG